MMSSYALVLAAFAEYWWLSHSLWLVYVMRMTP